MRTTHSSVITGLTAAAVTAQCVAGKATRDALFLSSLEFTALPAMLVATSVCSILLVVAHGKAGRSFSPAVLMPAILSASGALFLAEWFLQSAAPSAAAVLVYLHISGSGSLLASGFWLIVSERVDPRTAKRRFGQIAGAGTVGGLVGGLIAERVAATAGVPTMLLFLAAFQFLTAWLVRLLVLSTDGSVAGAAIDPVVHAPAPTRSGLRIVANSPHLHHLAALVLLGTTSAAMLEYLFKARAVETFGPGDNLLRLFAVYYAGISLITLVLQTVSSRSVLERFGLGLTSSAPSIALLTGSIASLVAPGFGSLLVARGTEAIFRGSWFRAGYELFYTPIPAAEKRAAKSVIDVGFDRFGDALGGGLIRLVMLVAPAAQSSVILSLAMVSSVGAIIAASRLNHWYIVTLESSLVRRGGVSDRSEMADDSIRKRVIGIPRRSASTHLRLVDTNASTRLTGPAAAVREATPSAIGPDREMKDILALRSRDRTRAIEVLSRDGGLPGSLIHHAIPLLAVDPLANHALFALCKAAEEHVGELADALLDPSRDDVIRRRLARVFAVCVSQRAADVLMAALEDARIDVRFQAARSLAAIREKNPLVRLDPERIYGLVGQEVGTPAGGQTLAHVFTLLSLVLPREPLRIAFRSLHSEDKQLRGTALEYLDGVLPARIRRRLWPLLVSRRGTPGWQHNHSTVPPLHAGPALTPRTTATSRKKAGLRG